MVLFPVSFSAGEARYSWEFVVRRAALVVRRGERAVLGVAHDPDVGRGQEDSAEGAKKPLLQQARHSGYVGATRAEIPA
ncbi:hypothetical protein [Streptomyces platensis]|uniref:hypothetical protein n=1 Tax=Streptomyces platensis TaxID=58346 RepID=UPI001F3F9129|nr:hypothetical protein [Streptomyces platensis]MCF3142035.1 hypothetical protein [Streptomyces platensis]